MLNCHIKTIFELFTAFVYVHLAVIKGQADAWLSAQRALKAAPDILIVFSCRTIGRDPFGDPNCVHISSITTNANQTYTVVVSDEDDFDAVLPARVVRYIRVSRQ